MSEPTLESLRAEGAQHHDPVRFRYLEVLAARLPAQPPAVQQVLAGRLQAAVADYAGRARTAVSSKPRAAVALAGAPSALVQLNRDLSTRAQADADSVLVGGGASVSDMKSVRRFSEVWSKIAAEQQVAQAFTRGPENAGPLNAHRLMLRSLALMRSLSPDYLRHFLSQMDSLLWLEQAAAKPARAPLKPGRAARSSKH
ncbi:DUF2894 domain-containing protein [Acidovorax sp.]|uniref:DUF2894 domain-containing protein n=1 Tax=Acidovorax sp. TaxID=1872122 RepID=UPI0027B9F15C|nr:DUF2894 domain-containing protein [Acidovorax sp.]